MWAPFDAGTRFLLHSSDAVIVLKCRIHCGHIPVEWGLKHLGGTDVIAGAFTAIRSVMDAREFAAMADISMNRKHGLQPEQVQATIAKLADKLVDRLGGSWCWDGTQAVCELKGAKARVGYDAEWVSIDVTLPRMMRPLRHRIEDKVDEYFERYFGAFEEEDED